MIKYKRTGGDITKDGHAMFHCDIVKELNRKAFLEQEFESRNKLIDELKDARDKHMQFLMDCAEDDSGREIAQNIFDTLEGLLAKKDR